MPYNSNPPTSGPHYVNPVPAGFYPQQLPDENLVHNLEHGHIWLSYRDQLDKDAIDLLSSIQRDNPQWVVVTYRPEDNNRVAAAAWQRLLVLNDLDEAQLRAFVQRYHNHAPESIPG